MKFKKKIKVAIDSPAAAGAGTQAKLIAKNYNLFYLDTGKIYRLIANLKLKNNPYNNKDIIISYKRASNIIDQELKIKKNDLLGQPESFLFKKEEEKHLYNKINEIRQYFKNTKKRESYDETLKILAEAKATTDNFFENVIVNDENSDIKKNRLELLQMFCKTYNNFMDFSKVEGA